MSVNVMEKFGRFQDHWHPRIIAELNGQHLKLAKIKGEFVWHDHAGEDELFLVYRGVLHLDFRDRDTVTLRPGDLYVVPRGVEHRPRTDNDEEVWLMLMEPSSTKHTGDVKTAMTVEKYEWI